VRPTIADTVLTDRSQLLSRGHVASSREELERTNEGLITLFRYANAAAEAKALPLLVEALVKAVEEAIAPDRVVPILVDLHTKERRPWLRQASALDRRLAEVPVSRTIIDFAFDERLSVLSQAPADDERRREGPSVQLNRIATAMCVPLRSGDELLGAVYVDRIGDATPFSRADLELLTALAMPTVVALNNLRAADDVHRECQALEREARGNCQVVGNSPKLQAVHEFIEKAAALDSPVLLAGDSGTGKELVARAIHYSGPRGKGPFEAVHCAALAEAALESELFGHVMGAFADAHEDRPGRLELARRGTLFLDEIAELPPASQARLLRVLETGEFRRLGDTRDRATDARVVAATNRDLPQLVDEGRFAKDLYGRLNTLTCQLPPLREHAEDIGPLCEHFLERFSHECGKPRPELTPAALQALSARRWPGNVRELRNLIERLVALCDKATLDADDLPAELGGASPSPAEPLASLQDVERAHIESVLRHTGGNKKEAARILNIDRSTLYAKIKTYKIEL